MPKPDFEKEQEENKIQYEHDPLVWHWQEHGRPVRCATDLTIYRNTTNSGITVTDDGLESPTSFRDVFGAHPSKAKDINFVIGHSTPGRLEFDPPSCSQEGRHAICPDSDRNNLTAVVDPNEVYTGTVIAHLYPDLWKEGCCVTFVPAEERLREFGKKRVCYSPHCIISPSPPPPSPSPTPPPL
jgi:hypothetical protein